MPTRAAAHADRSFDGERRAERLLGIACIAAACSFAACSGTSRRSESSSDPFPERASDASAKPSTEYGRLVDEYEGKLRALEDREEAEEQKPAAEETSSSAEGPGLPELIDEYVARFRSLAEAHHGQDVSGDAYAWIAVNAWKSEDVVAAARPLIDRFADRPYMMDVCASLTHRLDRAAAELLRSIGQVTHSAEIRAWARYCGATQDLMVAEVVTDLREASDPEKRKELRSSFTEDILSWLDSLDSSDAMRLRRDAEATFESLASSAGDLRYGDERIADLARSELHELRDLAIGRTAPNIHGEDVDGLAFSLDPYRGRVVVLDFWGNW